MYIANKAGDSHPEMTTLLLKLLPFRGSRSFMLITILTFLMVKSQYFFTKAGINIVEIGIVR